MERISRGLKEKALGLKNYLKRNYRRKEFWGAVVALVILFGIFYINTFHEKYPDEFDNILGGKYILQGRLPNSGFFTHHGPVTYFIAAFVMLFSGTSSFVSFRIGYSVFLFCFILGSYWYVRHSVGEKETRFYFYSIVILSIMATYYWFHMLVADSFSALCLFPVFILIFLKNLYNKPLTWRDYIFLSLFCATAVLSALTYIYVVGFLYLYLFFECWYTQKQKLFSRYTLKLITIVVLPYLVFGFYLLVTRSVSDYVYQSIIFNSRYYIYNYPHAPGSSGINPVRYAVVITHDFFNHFYPVLVMIKDLNFSYPLNSTMALSSITFLVYLLSKKKYMLFVFGFLIIIFANVRSNPLLSSEKDYQSAVYILFALFSASFVLNQIYVQLHTGKKQSILLGFLFVLLSVYGFFSTLFLFNTFKEKVYGKYMGIAPLIYDRPLIAPVINVITSKDDIVWIGPFAFEELFYLNGRLPSKYHIFNPGMGKSPEITNAMLQDFETNKPKIMYFDKQFYILGENPEMYGQPFLQFLQDNYITLNGNVIEGKKYASILPVTKDIDLETKLYINKDNISEVVQKLQDQNFIRQTQ